MAVNAVHGVSIFNLPADLQGLDMETMFLTLGAQRSEALDSVIQSQAADMAKRNENINKLNSALQVLRASRPASADAAGTFIPGPDNKTGNAEIGQAVKTIQDFGVPIPKGFGATLVDATVDPPTGCLWGDQKLFEGMIDNVKTEIDSQSSSAQLDMIKLQGLINKRNQTIEMLTNLVQKFSKTMDTIIGNMR